MPASYILRFCEADDVPRVMAFIDTYYRAGHALARRRDLFDWQYRESAGATRYSMVIAVDPVSSEVRGVLGFVDSKRYDPALAGANCVWLALWQVKPESKIPSLGLSLLRFVQTEVTHTSLAVSGIREVLKPLYRAMGFQVTELAHYFLLNPERREYRVAVIPADFTMPTPASASTDVQLFAIDRSRGSEELRDFVPPSRTPRKSLTYFVNRYLHHPFYDYLVFGIKRAHATVGLFAVRIVIEHEAKVMRIVDTLVDTEDLRSLGAPLRRLLEERGCEYADLLHTGLDGPALHDAGFAQVTPQSRVVIPNYFEPFVCENSRITACFRTTEVLPFIVCKADGDQDRPNLI